VVRWYGGAVKEWLYRRMWRWRKPRTKAQAMRSIRDHHRALGIPVDHLTDEELQRRIIAFGRSVNAACIPMREAQANIAAAFKAFSYSR
jgi:hypothetical protein